MATFLQYYKAYTMPTQKLREFALEAIAESNAQLRLDKKMRKTRLSLIEQQKRVYEMKEQQDRLHWEAQAEHTRQLQANIRAGLNNRWSR